MRRGRIDSGKNSIEWLCKIKLGGKESEKVTWFFNGIGSYD